MKLILNLLLLFVAFALIRRAIRRFLVPKDPPPVDHQQTDARPGADPTRSGSHPAIGKDEVIEDAEFEELD